MSGQGANLPLGRGKGILARCLSQKKKKPNHSQSCLVTIQDLSTSNGAFIASLCRVPFPLPCVSYYFRTCLASNCRVIVFHEERAIFLLKQKGQKLRSGQRLSWNDTLAHSEELIVVDFYYSRGLHSCSYVLFVKWKRRECDGSKEKGLPDGSGEKSQTTFLPRTVCSALEPIQKKDYELSMTVQVQYIVVCDLQLYKWIIGYWCSAQAQLIA